MCFARILIFVYAVLIVNLIFLIHVLNRVVNYLVIGRKTWTQAVGAEASS